MTGRVRDAPAFFALAIGGIESYHCGMSLQKISITAPNEYIAQVDEIAVRRKRSRSFIIAEAIEKYLDNGQAKPTTPATKKKAGSR